MTILTSANGSLPLTLRKGETLIVRNYSGADVVSGSSVSRERVTSLGDGVFAYGPQTSDATLVLASSGALDYQVVSGDPIPAADLSATLSVSNSPDGLRLPNGRGVSFSPAKRGGSGFKGSMGRQVTTWGAFSATQGNVSLVSDLPPVPDNATQSVRVVRSASPSSTAEATISVADSTVRTTYPSVGIWVKNAGARPLDFRVRFWNVGLTRSVSYGGTAAPNSGWQFYTLSPKATVAGSWTVGADQIGAVRVEQTDVGPNGAWLAGEELIFGTPYADPKGRPRFMMTFDDVPATVIRPFPMSASAPVSGRSAKQMLDYYGFKGTVYVVPALVGGASTNVTVSELQALIRYGWAIGSHSTTHPIDASGAGLRLLGPYGYQRSLAVGNGVANCRVTSTNAGTDVFTCEANHNMSVGGKLEFVDTAPTGFQTGVTYYVTAPSGATFKLATTPGNANAGTAIDITSDWTGVAEWRWPGSAPDDSAIYADIKGGIDGLTALGFTGHEQFFALPQGGWDHYVRTAVDRLGIIHTRGISSTAANHRSIHVGPSGYIGRPTGGTASSTPFWCSVFPQQGDAISTDQSFSLAQATAYVDEVIANGYTGANYHHSSADSPDVLDGLLAYLKTKSDAGLIDVLTVWDLADELRIG